MKAHDAKALHVARLVQQREQPELAILFGSRARGDHDDTRSDIDIMLVQAAEPGDADKKSAESAALIASLDAYGREVPVELVWRTLGQFRHNRRYVNSLESRAVRDGVIMPRDANRHDSSNYEDAETDYEYDWAGYEDRLRYANAHLDSIHPAWPRTECRRPGHWPAGAKRFGARPESSAGSPRCAIPQYPRHR